MPTDSGSANSLCEMSYWRLWPSRPPRTGGIAIWAWRWHSFYGYQENIVESSFALGVLLWSYQQFSSSSSGNAFDVYLQLDLMLEF